MLAIKPVFKIQNLRKDSTVKLYLQYWHSATVHPLLEKGISILPKYWNRKKICISDELPEFFAVAGELNEKLKNKPAMPYKLLLLK